MVKGEVEEGETPFRAALREFHEETGLRLPEEGDYIFLGSFKTSHKLLDVWALESDLPTKIRSNDFEIEWPPRSGKRARFPEVDQAAWMALSQAKTLIVASQLTILEKLEHLLAE